MCGIVGYTGSGAAAPILLKGLSRLEYRGYDSAGIAVLQASGTPAGRPTARPRIKTPTRICPTTGALPWCTTVLLKTTWSCAKS